jgi:hypothetical protein
MGLLDHLVLRALRTLTPTAFPPPEATPIPTIDPVAGRHGGRPDEGGLQVDKTRTRHPLDGDMSMAFTLRRECRRSRPAVKLCRCRPYDPISLGSVKEIAGMKVIIIKAAKIAM